MTALPVNETLIFRHTNFHVFIIAFKSSSMQTANI
uniref:Uncharacterized protein n=1 Tax=Rhizophora mucronata TaxID=61149 RepID=A0A2P2NK85_RHIMU